MPAQVEYPAWNINAIREELRRRGVPLRAPPPPVAAPAEPPTPHPEFTTPVMSGPSVHGLAPESPFAPPEPIQLPPEMAIGTPRSSAAGTYAQPVPTAPQAARDLAASGIRRGGGPDIPLDPERYIPDYARKMLPVLERSIPETAGESMDALRERLRILDAQQPQSPAAAPVPPPQQITEVSSGPDVPGPAPEQAMPPPAPVRQPPRMAPYTPDQSSAAGTYAQPVPTVEQFQRDLAAATAGRTPGEDTVLERPRGFWERLRGAPGATVDAARGAASSTGRALRNVPRDFMRTTTGRVETVFSPVDTVRGMYGIVSGLGQMFVPGEQMNEDYIREAGKAIYEKYGTLENARRTFEERPVEMALDLAGMRLIGAPRRLEERVRAMRAAREPEQRSTFREASVNLLPSLAGLAKDVLSPVHSPIEFGRTLVRLTKGVGGKAAAGLWEPEEERDVEAVVSYLTDRYGSWEGFRNAVRQDPAGVLADVAGVTAGGSWLGLKAGSAVGGAARRGSLGDRAFRFATQVDATRDARAALRASATPAADSAGRMRTGREAARKMKAMRESGAGPAARAFGRFAGPAEATLRGVGAAARAVDPARAIAGAVGAGAGRVASATGQGIAQMMGVGTRRPAESFVTAYRASRDNLTDKGERARYITRGEARRRNLDVLDTNKRIEPGMEEGSRQVFREQMRRQTPLDDVVDSVRKRIDEQRLAQNVSFPEGAAPTTGTNIRQPIRVDVDDPNIARTAVGVDLIQRARSVPDEVKRAAAKGMELYRRGITPEEQERIFGELTALGYEPDAARALMAKMNTPEPHGAVRFVTQFLDDMLESKVLQDPAGAGPGRVENITPIGRGVDNARKILFKAYGKEGATPPVIRHGMPDWGNLTDGPPASTREAVTRAYSAHFRQNPELANELAADIRTRRQAQDVADAGSLRKQRKAAGAEEAAAAQRLQDFFRTRANRGQPVSPAVRSIARAYRRGREGVLDEAVGQLRMTADELADLNTIRSILRPSAMTRARSVPAIARAAVGALGSMARPISRLAAQTAGGAILGGSRLAQRAALGALGRGYTTVPREVARGTRAGWRGRAGARAGATIAANQAAIRPVPATTGIRAAGDVVRRLRTGSGPFISNRTRRQIIRDVLRAKESVVGGAAEAGRGAVGSYLRARAGKGEREALSQMAHRLGAGVDARPGDPGKLGVATPSVAPELTARTARVPMNMDRVALAVDRAIHRTFRGLDVDPNTRRIRGQIGQWVNAILRQGKSYHNVGGADALMKTFDTAVQASRGGEIRSRAKDVLDAARNAARDAILEQAPKEYRDYLERVEAGRRHLRDAEKALSATQGQSAEVGLRKLLSTTGTHASSPADRRLRRQYLDSLNVPHIQERLAGISLDDVFPTGLDRQALAGGAALFGTAVSPIFYALAAGTSPRLMGELSSAAGGVAGSRIARALKASQAPANAPFTRAAGIAEGAVEDDPRNTARMMFDAAAEGVRAGYWTAEQASALVSALLSGADTATSFVFDRGQQAQQ